MYGRYGANGCFASYAGSPIYESNEGEYGVPLLLAIPVIAGGTALTGWAVKEGYDAHAAQTEAEGYTGGTIRWPGCEGTPEECTISADEGWRRVCETGVATAEHCSRSPSEEGAYWRDPPEGMGEYFTEIFVPSVLGGGYEGRKRGNYFAGEGDCPTGMSSEDPRCLGMNPEDPNLPQPRAIPLWVFGAAAAAIAATIIFSPTKKKGPA